MRTSPPYLSLDQAVDALLAIGPRLALAAPLGLGKPNRLLNALYARIKADPARHLMLYTALSLDLPAAGSELERRFLEPFLARHFGANYPRLDYVTDLKAGRLPPNVRVEEFYFQSGAMLESVQAQCSYASANYTHVARDLAENGIDAIVQLVARRGQGADARYSLSCNPDLTLDAIDAIAAAGKPRPKVIGVIHPDLPFLGGDASIESGFFDALVEETSAGQPLFALPLGSVDLIEYAIGLHASALVRDGGTLQIGIGALSDAIVHALLLRHQHNADYRDIVGALNGGHADADAPSARLGGLEPFARGLYGASEMVMDGFMHLRRAGILTRRVVDDLGRQKAIDAAHTVDPAMLHGGHYLKGAFFLGSKALYNWLRELDGEDWDGLAMCRVSDINQLYGEHEQLDAAQRRDARFFNTCMMATLLGAATSDALEDGRVVSGVGGQYNFVAMAHELAGGRSVLLLRATRRHGRRIESNLRWNYGHTTIPRHLRDVYVTEYGVADLRGKSDEACVRAMLAISDARFIDALVAEAIRAGKLPRDFRVPDTWRANTPEALRSALKPYAAKGLLPAFPFGSDFDATERRLLPALLWLKSASAQPRRWPALFGALLAPGAVADADACLARLGFDANDGGWRRALLARLVRAALARTTATK